ncbi:MAG: hypothetical protein FJX42_03695 [Alphaproteobacteria bacterium]|nr:hypothetical protein [Alphaproteobacteria bacterium]
MSVSVEQTSAWRASIERHYPVRAFHPVGAGDAAVSPWQALMAQAALNRGETPADRPDTTNWTPRIEPAPAQPAQPVKDSPDRIETATRSPAAGSVPGVFENGEFSFADLIDVINPLQHIPIVSTIYRELTGDKIGHAARLAGGVLFMGPLGGLTAIANVLIQESSGKDVGEHIMAMIKDDGPATTVANNNATPSLNNAANNNATPSPNNAASNTAMADAARMQLARLPQDATPIAGPSVNFASPVAANNASAQDHDLPPPPPRAPGPIAGPGWKGFYEQPPAESPAPTLTPPADAGRSRAPDPMAALAAKRTPGSMAPAVAAMSRQPRELPPEAGAIAPEGGWFADTMLEALSKYEEAQRRRRTQSPEAALDGPLGGAVNIVN